MKILFIGETVGVQPKIVHIPSDFIAKYDPIWGESLLGDKSHNVIFDNTKIKKIVPSFQASISFEQGIKEIIAYYDKNPSSQIVEEAINRLIDDMIQVYETGYPDK